MPQIFQYLANALMHLHSNYCVYSMHAVDIPMKWPDSKLI